MAKSPVKNFKVVVIGGSAGSLEVVLHIVEQLPANPRAVFIIILHRKNDKESILQSLIAQKTTLKVIEVEDKEMIHPDTIYLAPPDYHLLIENEIVDVPDFPVDRLDVMSDRVVDAAKSRIRPE